MAAIDFDRVKASIAALVRGALARVDYYALYACKVASQNNDGTLELTPDDNGRVPGVSKVKYKPGIPGVTVTVSSGTRVLLGFENGDPAKPYALGWDGGEGTVSKTVIEATEIDLGASASDFQIKGTSFMNQVNSAISTLQTSNTAIPPATTLPTAIAAITALIAEIAAFCVSMNTATGSSNLSTKNKVE